MRERDAEGEDMVPSLLEEWPIFQYGSYLMEELKMILGKTDKEMTDVRSDAAKAVCVLTSMVPKDNWKRKVCHVLKRSLLTGNMRFRFWFRFFRFLSGKCIALHCPLTANFKLYAHHSYSLSSTITHINQF